MHTNSVESYAALPPGREAAVLAAYRASTRHLTDREVATALGFADLNAVRPTITLLLENGRLLETGRRRCGVTQRPVRTCTTPREGVAPAAPRRSKLTVARNRAKRAQAALEAGDHAAVRRHLERIVGL